jgi:hypothetical protein
MVVAVFFLGLCDEVIISEMVSGSFKVELQEPTCFDHVHVPLSIRPPQGLYTK